MMSDLIAIERLLLVMVLAGFIGFERERQGRAAGFRTHILVAVGSCLVMMTGLYLAEAQTGGGNVDPTRMASQVVSGIGFLGAGTILQFRASVRGLTTAASLWAAAGIGIAVGAGFLSAALAATVVVFLSLFALGRWERAMRRAWYRLLIVDTQGGSDELSRIRRVLAGHGVEIQDFEIKRTSDPSLTRVELHVKLVAERDEDTILGEVVRLEGTRRAHWA